MRSARPAIVLIHGRWTTPRIWESFRHFYEERGFRVFAPPWPRLCGEVEQIRRDPGALAGLGLREVVGHFDLFVRSLDERPIVMGHSDGGLVAQILLDRGLGAAGVALAPLAPKGIFRPSFTRAVEAGLVQHYPLDYWRVVSLSLTQFRHVFANTMTERDARLAYQRYVVPAPGRPHFELALADLHPRSASRIDFQNHDRRPLLLVAGSEDRFSPPAVVRRTHSRYAGSQAVTRYKEFTRRSHLIIAQDGWREVADYVLNRTIAELRRGSMRRQEPKIDIMKTSRSGLFDRSPLPPEVVNS